MSKSQAQRVLDSRPCRLRGDPREGIANWHDDQGPHPRRFAHHACPETRSSHSLLRSVSSDPFGEAPAFDLMTERRRVADTHFPRPTTHLSFRSASPDKSGCQPSFGNIGMVARPGHASFQEPLSHDSNRIEITFFTKRMKQSGPKGNCYTTVVIVAAQCSTAVASKAS